MDTHIKRLNNDLNHRLNPEITRNFSLQEMQQGLKRLLELSCEKWLTPRGQRIVVVGSNGKGSTAYFLAALGNNMMRDPDTKGTFPFSGKPITGLYMSPHLTTVLERVRLNLTPISPKEAWETMEELQKRLGARYEQISFFEILTILAQRIFIRHDCALSVYECGLGGRLDATQIARPQTVVLTNITLEHTAQLGTTPEAILEEKLGMISPNTTRLFAMPQQHISNQHLTERAKALNNNITVHIFPETATEHDGSYLEYNLRFSHYCWRTLGARPRITSYNIPGRLEMRTVEGDFRFLFDVAHNPPAIRLTLQNLSHNEHFPGPKKTLLLFGLLPDRNMTDAITALQESGFTKYHQLCADFLAPPMPSVPTLQLAKVDAPLIFQLLKEENTQFCIILGSHRLYPLFEKLSAGYFH